MADLTDAYNTVIQEDTAILTAEADDSDMDDPPEVTAITSTCDTTSNKSCREITFEEKDFVVVKFVTEEDGRNKFYVGQIANILEESQLEIKFLRKTGRKRYFSHSQMYLTLRLYTLMMLRVN